MGETRRTLGITLVLLVLCGLAFPLLLTGASALIFPRQAAGSLIYADGKAIGAEKVGQEFTEDYYLWGRPSTYHYNVYEESANGKLTYRDGSEFPGIASGSENYAASNPDLHKRVQTDLEDFLKKNPSVKAEDIPTDLLTASGSGLDPDISPAAAQVQIPRIAKASGLDESTVEKIVSEHTSHKLLGVFGEETVNVLGVNLDISHKMSQAK